MSARTSLDAHQGTRFRLDWKRATLRGLRRHSLRRTGRQWLLFEELGREWLDYVQLAEASSLGLLPGRIELW